MRSTQCASEYQLEQYHLKLLPQRKQRALKGHIDACEICQQHLKDIEDSWATDDMLGHDIPSRFASDETVTSPRGWLWPEFGIVSASVALLALFVWNSHDNGLPTGQHHAKVRIKSHGQRWIAKGNTDPKWFVAQLRHGQVKRAKSGQVFPHGTRLRLAYRWAKGGYVFVVHRDAKGTISPLYPPESNQPSLRIKSPKAVLLPGSLVVEASHDGNEEIISCFSHKPLRFVNVKQQIAHPTRKGKCVQLKHFLLRHPRTRQPAKRNKP
jgi:hypothetical protein